jgi:hypothetical protein
MYKFKKFGKVFTSKFIGTGPSSYEKRIYRAVISQRLRNNGLKQELWGFVTATHASTLDVRCWSYCNRSRHNGTNLISVMLNRRSGPLLTEAVAYETFHSVINHGRNIVHAVTSHVICRFLITNF